VCYTPRVDHRPRDGATLNTLPSFRWIVLRARLAAPFLLACAFFLFYSQPLWSSAPYHPSLTEADRLHHDDFRNFLAAGRGAFPKYSVGAHFLDWLAVEAMPDRFAPPWAVGDYIPISGMFSAWYHCLLAAIAPLLLFAILRRRVGVGLALFGMALFGLAPAMTYFSCNAGVNVPFLTFGLATLLCFDGWLRARSLRAAIGVGVFAALAFLYKEFFGLSLVMFPLVLWATRRDAGERVFSRAEVGRAVAATTTFVGLVFALSFEWRQPGVYLSHWSYFLDSGRALRVPLRMWLRDAPPLADWALNAMIGLVLTGSQTIWAGLLALFGLHESLIESRRRLWILALPLLPYAAVILFRYNLGYYPYRLPVLPFLCGAAAVGLAVTAESPRRAIRWLGRVAAAAALLSLATQSWLVHRDLANDPRLQVQRFVSALSQRAPLVIALVEGDRAVAPQFIGVRVLRYEVEPDSKPDSAPNVTVIEREKATAWLARAGLPSGDDNLRRLPALILGEAEKFTLARTFKNTRPFFQYRYGGLNGVYHVFLREDLLPDAPRF
jgi:hypothetical protein